MPNFAKNNSVTKTQTQNESLLVAMERMSITDHYQRIYNTDPTPTAS